jgi:hypothetical protein
VYSRQIEGQNHTFGVSGRLYKSNVLLYDHQTESLWSQLMERSISGPLAGKPLEKIAATRTRWHTWINRNPDTLVLSENTGYDRNYAIDPYEGYYTVGALMFPVGNVRRELAVKARVLVIQIEKEAKASPLKWLGANPGIHKDRLAGQIIEIEVNSEGEVVSVRHQNGKPIASIYSYWFAWQAFHPGTQVFQKSGN